MSTSRTESQEPQGQTACGGCAAACCERLSKTLDALSRAEARIRELEGQLHESSKLAELQAADLERYRKVVEASTRNRPERVKQEELQLAFARVLESTASAPASAASNTDQVVPAVAAATSAAQGEQTQAPSTTAQDTQTQTAAPGAARRRHAHGRRALDLSTLPVKPIVIDPPEVLAEGEAGFNLIGEETSWRVALQPSAYFALKIVRRKWARKPPPGAHGAPACIEACTPHETPGPAPVVVAPLPEGVWPGLMGDPSAIAGVIVSKYDDSLPLHRQERISTRHGFTLPRSTQCGWLSAALPVCRRVVDAMFEEARASAHCMATDATGAPVRAPGACENWHVFVFIADHDHVVFRYNRKHNSAVVGEMLQGFRGFLLADAAVIYDALYRDGDIIEVACWAHARRYAWRALTTERQWALELMAVIGELFAVVRACWSIPMPQRTAERAARAQPVLDRFDRWVDGHRARLDPGGKLVKAITYCDNQREALRRFLTDGTLRPDNNISEQQLRAVVLGRDNWHYFANERGLEYYTTFRSLLASCALHALNTQHYLEQLLRLAPHWPVNRTLELSPKYWARTVAALDARHSALLAPPWEATSASSATGGRDIDAPARAA